MSNETLTLTPQAYDYLQRQGVREPQALADLRAATAEQAGAAAGMQIAPEQGAFMAMLVSLMGARKTLEAGVFTGYSAAAVALALPDDGTLVACDISDKWSGLAQEYWQLAGVADKIDLHIAPATQTMDALIDGGESGTFDFIFLDAEKSEYQAYYIRALALLRPGGLVAIDNVLWSGRVADDTAIDADTVAIRAFNAMVHDDDRVTVSMVPIADGLTLAQKK
ncbi:MAG: SAM-dependent methyltransferase [Alphaproteobacteria bacterium]|jgi:predicted O-methyltransferase YrrM|nr:SAM-dependent methyltransferase [Alphaproteobacteria bacterium]